MSTESSTLADYSPESEFPSMAVMRRLTGPTPSASAEAIINRLTRFGTIVTLEDELGPYLVGGSIGRQVCDYRLYHRPTDAANSGLAGVLRCEKHLTERGEPDEYRFGFESSDSCAGEGPIRHIQSISAYPHALNQRLDSLLPELRTHLTDTDWVDADHPDAGYGEWLQAASSLADNIAETETPYAIEPNDIHRNRVTHAIARYPLTAVDLLAQVEQCFIDTRDDGVENTTPEAIRQLLFDYADEHSVSSYADD
jgi:hypothetical protein